MVRFLVRLVTVLVVLALIGFVGFAFVGDLSAERTQERVPVAIPLD